jgi:hypothetical protein
VSGLAFAQRASPTSHKPAGRVGARGASIISASSVTLKNMDFTNAATVDFPSTATFLTGTFSGGGACTQPNP